MHKYHAPKVQYSIRKLNSEQRKGHPFFSSSRRRSEAVISSAQVKISSNSKTCDMSDWPGGAMVLAFQLLGMPW